METRVNDLKTAFDHKDDKGNSVGYDWEGGSTKRNTRFIFATRQIPLYDGAPAGLVVDEIDMGQSRTNNPAVSKAELGGAMKVYNSHDAPGHIPNIKAAREGCSNLKTVVYS